MFNTVLLLMCLTRLPREISCLHTCTPNTQFMLNGKLCFCDNRGLSNEANCRPISRRQSCQPGQIIWQGCNQCICQDNGYLLCSHSCSDFKSVLRHGLAAYGLRCTPFRSYYIDCSICVCPASGDTSEAQCVADVSCNAQNNQMALYMANVGSKEKTYCIPNVMYLTHCLQCLCPDSGYFNADNCVEKCTQSTSTVRPVKHCNPGSLYRKDCNICRCPNTSIADDSLCISAICNKTSIHVLGTDGKDCAPYSFTVPKCMYCECDSKGVVNEDACLQIDCAKRNVLGYQNVGASTCHPDEMVPICAECFCTKNGRAIAKYCSRFCSNENRLNVLETVLKDASDSDVIEISQIKRVTGNGHCTPNSLYLNNGRYCLCPDSANTDNKLCTSVSETPKHSDQSVVSNNIEIDYNSPCEPNTFVEFDCNTCYCSRNGKIDPKWCTYDDCKAKRLVQESHANHDLAVEVYESGPCQPGAIMKLKCNYCICPETGIINEKSCTQNDCTEFDQTVYTDNITCEPLAYYEIDCNICYCPRDGIKNVAKCTKNPCEKSILRSESCIPGQLFSDGCNLCVCPPDGNKTGKACTSRDCPEVPGKVLELFDDFLDSHVNYTRSLDHCFPGEEFVAGCKLCICSELGLKIYATCESVCDEQNENVELQETTSREKRAVSQFNQRPRRSAGCLSTNDTTSAERQECTPGTMYIIRCKQCICPYAGNINRFCRPLPKKMYCEQAFPYFNFLPMGRRIKDAETKTTRNVTNNTDESRFKHIQVEIKHDKHTEFKCEKSGTILDKCYICDCDEGKIIQEHCFKSDADNCADAKPTFLIEDKVEF